MSENQCKLSSRILVKFPTKSRPEKFTNTILGYIANQTTSGVSYLVTIDEDDETMKNFELPIQNQLNVAFDVNYCCGRSKSKVDAVNRDMDLVEDIFGEIDLIVLASDDMICEVKGWDEILLNELNMHFPNRDGVLYHWDGDLATKKHNNGKGLNTMCIIGMAYYKRFGYIYEPSYKSLWCDNEFTEVADKLGKQYRSDLVLFRHVHHSNNPLVKIDKLMAYTQSFYKEDAINYERRKALNFGL